MNVRNSILRGLQEAVEYSAGNKKVDNKKKPAMFIAGFLLIYKNI